MTAATHRYHRGSESELREFLVFSYKAFGDLVIALSSIRRVLPTENSRSVKILAGHHLEPLVFALDPPSGLVRFFGSGASNSMPAAFDVRGQGKLAALKSLIDLRRLVGPSVKESTLVVDRLGWRVKFISGSSRLLPLPTEPRNIYLAYDEFFHRAGLELRTSGWNQVPAPKLAAIVPGSRVSAKVIPPNVLRRVFTLLNDCGIAGHVVKMDGEKFDIPEGAPVRTVPRTFPSLIAAIDEVDLVISADSLAAHLAEYLYRRSFVIAPTLNPYWLPRRAFTEGASSSFDSLNPLEMWLKGPLGSNAVTNQGAYDVAVSGYIS